MVRCSDFPFHFYLSPSRAPGSRSPDRLSPLASRLPPSPKSVLAVVVLRRKSARLCSSPSPIPSPSVDWLDFVLLGSILLGVTPPLCLTPFVFDSRRRLLLRPESFKLRLLQAGERVPKSLIKQFSMGKNEFLTPKAIANRIKAKGLQKLRWYCQMCQKQCRDENEEFESSFLEHMKRSHRFSRIAATVVYNEYISDRHHVHMNSTQWATLIDFIKYLGRTGKCKVEETPKGWFITYIDRDSETLFKEREKNKRIRADMADEEKQEREIGRQIERVERFMPMMSAGEGPVRKNKMGM
ncbi:DNA/RNA-binding protein kin17 [Dionaea muscipula]